MIPPMGIAAVGLSRQADVGNDDDSPTTVERIPEQRSLVVDSRHRAARGVCPAGSPRHGRRNALSDSKFGRERGARREPHACGRRDGIGVCHRGRQGPPGRRSTRGQRRQRMFGCGHGALLDCEPRHGGACAAPRRTPRNLGRRGVRHTGRAHPSRDGTPRAARPFRPLPAADLGHVLARHTRSARERVVPAQGPADGTHREEDQP